MPKNVRMDLLLVVECLQEPLQTLDGIISVWFIAALQTYALSLNLSLQFHEPKLTTELNLDKMPVS